MTEASTASSISPSASLRAWVSSALIMRRSSASAAAGVRGVGRLDRGSWVMICSLVSALQARQIAFARLGHLRRDDHLAVWLVGILLEVILVVRLGWVEPVQRFDLGDEPVPPGARAVDFGDHFPGHALLLGRLVEDRRAILRPDISALSIEGRRIVDREEHFEEL